MKTKSLLLLTAILATALSFTGCAGGGNEPQTASSSTKKSDHRDSDNSDSDSSTKKPRIGMTQHQVRETYGDPTNVSQTGDGEVWTYWFNKGHAFIPYNFGYRARTGTFFFDSRGVLKNFSINE